MGTANVAISDCVEPAAQPRARAMVASAQGVGFVLGSFASGQLRAKSGPVAPYVAAVCAGALAASNIVLRQPETHCRNGQLQHLSPVSHNTPRGKPADKDVQRSSALQILLQDSEARCLSLWLGIQDLALLPQFSDVATQFFRDTLVWDPQTIGRFISTYGITNVVGAQATGTLVDRFGPELQATLSHVGLSLAFLVWGSARNSTAMIAALFPLLLGFGRGPVLQSKAIARAAELGLGKGEAMAAVGTL